MNATTSKHTFADRISSIPQSFIREILKVASQNDVISFAGGLPHPDFFPHERIAAAAEKVLLKDGKNALQYAPTEGFLPLRDFIAQRQSVKEKRKIDAEDVVMLNGSQQGLDLAGKLFLNKQSNVLLEQPSYLGAIQAFSAYEPEFQSVKMTRTGPDIHHLSHLVKKHNPSFFYCIPNFQNPTGKQYSLEERIKTVETMWSSDTMIIEDNPYGEIYFEGNDLPELHSLMPDKTILLGSFSKIISPGLRLGWAIAPKEISQKLTIAKQASDLHSNNLAQRIIYQFLLDNNLDDHLQQIRNFYKQQSQLMTTLLTSALPQEVTWNTPVGGMFLWVELPQKITATSLLEEAIKHKIVFVPGKHFYPSGTGDDHSFRMNFSNPSKEEMSIGIATMGRIIKSML